MTDDNMDINSNEINPKDELLDAVAELDDEGDRVIELTDDETGEKFNAIVADVFEMNGKNYVVLIVDYDEDDEDVEYYEIMALVEKDGEVALETLSDKEHDIIDEYYTKLCDELYGDDEESEDE